ncbi:MAG: hypothetical protein R3240_10730, partial [Gammaproteobacteria bacterium]|nr:hypothetical protein [Gammaproteobacteria bacterium]
MINITILFLFLFPLCGFAGMGPAYLHPFSPISKDAEASTGFGGPYLSIDDNGNGLAVSVFNYKNPENQKEVFEYYSQVITRNNNVFQAKLIARHETNYFTDLGEVKTIHAKNNGDIIVIYNLRVQLEPS